MVLMTLDVYVVFWMEEDWKSQTYKFDNYMLQGNITE